MAELKTRTIEREEIYKQLEAIMDLERLTSRVTTGIATPRDLLALSQSLARVPAIRRHHATHGAPRCARLSELHARLDDLPEIRHRIDRAIADSPPVSPADPGIIRAGYNPELDELRALSKSSKQVIAAMEERERKRTGIGSQKIRFNNIFGYYIEMSKSILAAAPADYERKHTLVGAERFTSAELKDYEQGAGRRRTHPGDRTPPIRRTEGSGGA